MLDLRGVILFSDHHHELIEFYKKVLSGEQIWSGGDFASFKVGMGYLTIGPHSEVHGNSINPERIIIYLEADDVQKEFDRIKALGVTIITEPYHPKEFPESTVATFADPDNNFFQIETPISKLMPKLE